MILRLILAIGLFAVGYYLGREVGRQMPIRRELDAARSRGDYTEVEATVPEDETVEEPAEMGSDSQT